MSTPHPVEWCLDTTIDRSGTTRRGGLRGKALDAAVAEVARRRQMVVRRDQLIGLGMGVGGIQHRLGGARLRSLYPGVYAVGPGPLSMRGEWRAAVDACGEESALCDRSSAQLYDLAGGRLRPIHVVSPGAFARDLPGVTHHRDRLAARDVTEVDGIPVVTVARAILALGARGGIVAASRGMEEAERRGILNLDDVDELLARCRGVRGIARLRVARSLYEPPPEGIESWLEDVSRRLVELASVPEPLRNVEIEGIRADIVWLAARLVVEVDGWDTHRTRAAFERDRRRDAHLAAQGWLVLRFTYRDLTSGLARSASQLARVHRNRTAEAAPSNRVVPRHDY